MASCAFGTDCIVVVGFAKVEKKRQRNERGRVHTRERDRGDGVVESQSEVVGRVCKR